MGNNFRGLDWQVTQASRNDEASSARIFSMLERVCANGLLQFN
jgi:hypothetical protein